MANKEFNQVMVKRPDSNRFDLSHDHKTTCNFGQLVPILCKEALPGDKWNIGAEALVRFAPMVAPVMHRFDVTVDYFFVPNRILWEGWPDWISGNAIDSCPVFQYFGNAGDPEKKFLNYMGIPRNDTNRSLNINALPLAAYQCVYNEYYRDQNLIEEVDYKLNSGDNTRQALVTLRRRAWEHDYFTSALPFAQKGQPIDIPLGEVVADFSNQNNPLIWKVGGNQFADDGILQSTFGEFFDANGDPVIYDPQGSLNVAPTSINDLRRAMKLQEFLEINARGGTRYTEKIKAHFGVNSSDGRLMRPEFITRISSPVTISEVLNTTGTQTRPQGDMAGHGLSVMGGKMGSHYCEEHGWIIGILSVLPKTAYAQGVERQFTKFDPLDYYWPSFAHIGEQEVKVKEIFAYTSADDNTWGYMPRYSEYKHAFNRISGDFVEGLDFWTATRFFSNAPNLNRQFIECDNTPIDRIFAVTNPNIDKLYCVVLNKISVSRKIPEFSIPSIQ